MKRLRELLIKKQETVSLREIARQSGVDYGSVQKYADSEHVEPRSGNLGKMARYFGVSPEWLRGGEDEVRTAVPQERQEIIDLVLALSPDEADVVLRLLHKMTKG